MLVDSKKTKLGVEAIIVASAAETDSSHPIATAYAAIVKELNIKGTIPLQEGNTLFIIHHVSSRIGFFRALNADIAKNYLANSLEFVKAAYKLGYDELYTEFESPSILNIFKAIKRNPPNEDMEFVAQEKDGKYIVTLYLGPTREREK
jgi:hypothetical protein